MLLQQFYNLRPRPRRVVPYPDQKRQVQLLAAALGHVRPANAPVRQRALQHAPEADGAREVEEDNRVAYGEPHVERARVVAVNDPRFTVDEFSDPSPPLVFRRLDPARPPVLHVQVYDVYAEQRAETAREC